MFCGALFVAGKWPLYEFDHPGLPWYYIICLYFFSRFFVMIVVLSIENEWCGSSIKAKLNGVVY